MKTSNNIILIGMPGSGKSTAGVVLAKVLGYGFIDTDLLIQMRSNARLEDMIASKGIDEFLDMESDVCMSLDVDHTVIATGGSVIYRDRTMQYLKTLGQVVYLEVGIDELRNRLSDMKKRGVVLKENQDLESLLEERVGLYQKYADIVINESGLGLEETVEQISEKWPGQNGCSE